MTWKLEPKPDMTTLELLELVIWTFGTNLKDKTKLAEVTCPDSHFKNLSLELQRHFKKDN